MSLDKRIEEIFARTGKEVIAAVRASLAEEIKHLTGGTTKRGKVAKAKRGGGGRRSSKQIAAGVEKLLLFVKKHPGLRTEAIIQRFGGNATNIKDGLARLRSTNKVKTKGIKRAMTYSA